MGKNKIKDNFKNIFSDIKRALKRQEMRVLPGNLAFYLLMSFIPIVAIVVFICSRISVDYDIVGAMTGHVPNVVIDMINSAVLSAKSYGNIILLFIFYIFLASNGPLSIIRCSNALYGIKDPKWIQSRIKAVFMTVILVLLLLFMIIIPVFGDTIIGFIISLLDHPERFYDYMPIYQFIKIVVTFIFVFLSIKLIYVLAPDKRVSGKSTTIGTLFTAITWVILTELFSFYVTSIASYDLLYGNFANVLVLLMWVYFLAFLFVVGLGINSECSRRLENKK